MRRSRQRRAPPVAHQNPAFMESVSARPIRILAEYLDPLVRLRREGVGDTIVMFGSARVEPRERALARLDRLERGRRGRASSAAQARSREARAALRMSRYYEEARELARPITAWAPSVRGALSSARGAGRGSWRPPIVARPTPAANPSA